MARFVKETGTGEIGMTMDIGPKIQVMAVINAISVSDSVFVFVISAPFLSSIL